MTAEEFVKEYYPQAQAERHVSGMIKGLQEVYWLIRENATLCTLRKEHQKATLGLMQRKGYLNCNRKGI